jgi:lipopolysaccharide biosynthesis glycosyltransferase
MATIRITNPSCKIYVACDNQTFNNLTETNSPLFKEADEVFGFETPEGHEVFRNRFVKTKLGSLLSESFLFLDSDTIVRGSLLPLWETNADLAGAINHSTDDIAKQVWSEDLDNIRTMHWDFDYPYINGGVLWYAGTVGSKKFSLTWHELWLANVNRTQRYRDQPALNAAIKQSKVRFNLLHHKWNAQVQGAPKEAKNAVIWHLYINWNKENIFEFRRQLNLLPDFKQFEPTLIAKKLLSKKHPWCSRSILDDMVASRIISKNILPLSIFKWFSLNPSKFIRWTLKNHL